MTRREGQPHDRGPVDRRDPALRRVRGRHRPQSRSPPTGGASRSGLAATTACACSTARRARNCSPIAIMATIVYGLAFAPDGALITSSYDGQLRRYGPDLKLTVKRPAPDGKQPYGVAIDPSGRRVAVGYDDETPVSILDATTLAPLAKAQTGDLGERRFVERRLVARRRDARRRRAARRRNSTANGAHFCADSTPTGRRQGADIAASSNTDHGHPALRRRLRFRRRTTRRSASSPRKASRPILQGPRTADMRDKVGSAFAVSRDALSVRFGLGYGDEKPVVFDLAAASLTDSPSLPPASRRRKVDGLPGDGLGRQLRAEVQRRETRARQTTKRPAHWRSGPTRPASCSEPNCGSAPSTRRASSAGSSAGPGVAWGVDFSADGEILVVAYGDGTIRWLRWSGRRRSCSRCSSSRRAANGSPGRRPAITWPRPAARI